MSSIQNLFQQAKLAEAAYANFIDPITGLPYVGQEKITASLIDSGFSSDPNDLNVCFWPEADVQISRFSCRSAHTCVIRLRS